MVLLWVFVGLILAWFIARINQSNKLFWILFTSFMVGIAGGSVYHKVTEAQRKTSASDVYHTLSIHDTISKISSVTIDENVTTDTNVSTSVGNGEHQTTAEVTLSKCFIETRKQPPKIISKACWNILTHPNYKYAI